jgi:hypothetical protein
MLMLREPAGALECAVHAAHAAFAVVFLKVLAAQGAQATPVDGDACPLGAKPGVQRHSPASVDARSGVNACSLQNAQAAAPASVLNCPRAHAAQGPPSAPVKPALHWHAEAPALRAGATLFAGQGRQASPASKVSAAHSAHASPGPPAKPAAHRQSVSASLAGGDAAFAGHKLHSALPGAVLNVPAAHAAHAPPSAPV